MKTRIIGVGLVSTGLVTSLYGAFEFGSVVTAWGVTKIVENGFSNDAFAYFGLMPADAHKLFTDRGLFKKLDKRAFVSIGSIAGGVIATGIGVSYLMRPNS